LKKRGISILALGDSYTAGEAVEKSQGWPMQLSSGLSDIGFEIDGVRLIAMTGWTTNKLMSAIQNAMPLAKYDIVSLQIGVNNQYKGYLIDQYKRDFGQLLDMAIVFARRGARGTIGISIPDYGVTPFGQKMDFEKIANEIREYNEIASAICKNKNVNFINITDISTRAAFETDLTTVDQLHPSAKMYSLWADLIVDEIKDLIR